ncbi:MAG: hypothetical protein JW810_03045 [Sedimentisphaerales bacterium]|nr:hypothetical protein [Sedimentisphaerales bacterium]
MMSNRLVELQLYHLRLPFRHKFTHATAERAATDTVLCAALLADGTVGYGEGLPRPYVTGESVESVLFHVEDTLAGLLRQVEPRRFADLLELADSLPLRSDRGQIISSARCCVELALLDAYGKHFQVPLTRIAGWLGYGGFLAPANRDRTGIGPVRVSGVLDGSNPATLRKRLRLMRWYGLRDFKLKLGCPDDDQNLDLVYRRLERDLIRERVTLRVDANGAWDVDSAMAMIPKLVLRQVCCLEQPLAASDRDHLHTLADLSRIPLMADESLITPADAEFLGQNDLVDNFNIRISKNGGLLPALRMAETARKYSRDITLGAMVGESAVLAAAGRQFLQIVPQVRFTEICYGTFLLQEDLSRETMRFGYGGRLKSLTRPGLGIHIRRDRMVKFLAAPPRQIPLA